MPLHQDLAVKKILITTKIRKTINQVLAYLKPDTIFAVFMVVSILLAFSGKTTGFYAIFSVFIVCYFAERITNLLRKR